MVRQLPEFRRNPARECIRCGPTVFITAPVSATRQNPTTPPNCAMSPTTSTSKAIRFEGAPAQVVVSVAPLTVHALSAALIAIAGVVPAPVRAADGCLVLLCLAAPSWRNIAPCVDPVRQVLRDLARGRPFPSCSMSGAGNSASHQWSSAPGYCPAQYTYVSEGVNSPVYSCGYAGAVSVDVQGSLWARVWWNPSGDSVTEFTPAAKARLGSWATRFDDDYAAWLASLAPPPSACASC